MAVRCPSCGEVNRPAALFCSRCGKPLPAEDAALAGRTQTITGKLPNQTLLGQRYVVLRKLGQGGMGAIYLAEDRRIPGKQWVVKEMSDSALGDPVERQAAVEAFRQEAQLLATLDHPNLPRVVDHFDEGSRHYLVMDFVEGESLEKRLALTPSGIPEAEVRLVLAQLCDVLEYLHSRTPQVIFRDLKPANIMLQPDGKVKLIDFGIARVFKAGKSGDTAALGTPGYAAPEQYGRGQSQSDERTDIYALGATLHHLLSGESPVFNSFNFPPLRTLNPAISAEMEAMVARAVKVHPDDRWQSVREMCAALGNSQDKSGADSRPLPSPATLPVVVGGQSPTSQGPSMLLPQPATKASSISLSQRKTNFPQIRLGNANTTYASLPFDTLLPHRWRWRTIEVSSKTSVQAEFVSDANWLKVRPARIQIAAGSYRLVSVCVCTRGMNNDAKHYGHVQIRTELGNRGTIPVSMLTELPTLADSLGRMAQSIACGAGIGFVAAVVPSLLLIAGGVGWNWALIGTIVGVSSVMFALIGLWLQDVFNLCTTVLIYGVVWSLFSGVLVLLVSLLAAYLALNTSIIWLPSEGIVIAGWIAIVLFLLLRPRFWESTA